MSATNKYSYKSSKAPDDKETEHLEYLAIDHN
jgi:hypothetical protein